MKKLWMFSFGIFILSLLSLSNIISADSPHNPTINSVTVNGTSSVTVAPNTPLTIVVNASTHDASSQANWRSTGIRIATNAFGPFTCLDNTDLHNGTASRTFNRNAPNTNGTYNIYVKAYNESQDCDGTPSNTFNLSSSVIVQTTGSLSVTKNTVGGNGTFSMTGTGTIGNFNLTTTNGTATQTFNNLTPGNHTITETTPSGWDKTGDTCANVTVTALQTATCTITNTKRGSITVSKNVVGVNGGEVTDTHAFSVTLNGSSTQTISENAPFTYTNLVPGTYTIAENTDENYTFDSFSEDSDSETSGSQIVVGAGQNVNLTITNKQKYGHLTVIKHVDNSHGLGTSTASEFTMNVTGVEPFTGNEEGTTVDLNPGQYEVTETSDISGYAMGQSADCAGTIGSNENKTCTITNYDLDPEKGAIVLVKNLVLDNGGNASVGDFNLRINQIEGEPMSVSSGQVTELDPGTYTVSEYVPENLQEKYTQTGITCTDNGESMEGNSINLMAGHVYRCTITNNDIPASLTIVKNTDNENNNGTFNFAISGTELAPSLTTQNGHGETSIELNKGSYNIQELVPENWNFQSVSCVYENESVGNEIENGENITVDNGDAVTCTFTNKKQDEPVVTVNGGGGLNPQPENPNPENTPAPDGNSDQGQNGQVLGISTEKQPEGGKVLGETSCNTIYLSEYIFYQKKNNKDQVKLLQTFLNENLGIKLTVDGIYKAKSRDAVKAFQEKYKDKILAPWVKYGQNDGSTGTGNVYKTTKWWINMLKCPDLNLPMPELP
jgi:uncharacterized protein (DUF2141 family)